MARATGLESTAALRRSLTGVTPPGLNGDAETFNVKVKGLPTDVLEIKLITGAPTFDSVAHVNMSDTTISQDLGDGWASSAFQLTGSVTQSTCRHTRAG